MKIQDCSVVDIIAASIIVYNDHSFIKSGYGHVEYDDEGNVIREVKDNKSMINDMLTKGVSFTDEQITQANELADSINGKMMLKKLTGQPILKSLLLKLLVKQQL